MPVTAEADARRAEGAPAENRRAQTLRPSRRSNRTGPPCGDMAALTMDRPGAPEVQRVGRPLHLVHGYAFDPEPARRGLGQRLVVFGQQHRHRRFPDPNGPAARMAGAALGGTTVRQPLRKLTSACRAEGPPSKGSRKARRRDDPCAMLGYDLRPNISFGLGCMYRTGEVESFDGRRRSQPPRGRRGCGVVARARRRRCSITLRRSRRRPCMRRWPVPPP